MDQATLVTLARALTLIGGIASTVLGLLFFSPPESLHALKERISWWTGSSNFPRSAKHVVLHSTDARLTGAILLFVGILLFARSFTF